MLFPSLMRFQLVIFSALLLIQSPSSKAIVFQGHHMVASAPSPAAIETMKKISLSGGNVVDAAVAMGLTLAVTSPYFASLGGGGFALVRLKNQVQVIDFREVAPRETSKSFFLSDANPKASIFGGKAIGVPGVPAGLWELHKRYGHLPWTQLFSEALELAKNGFRVSGEWAQKTKDMKDNFNQAGRDFFFRKNANFLKPGELLSQSQLAVALKRFRDQGLKGFYQGAVAEDLIQSIKKNGGVMNLDDLKNYQVKWRKPLSLDLHGFRFHLMPPPSSGGLVIAQALQLIDLLKPDQYPALGIEEAHLISEIFSRAFRSRSLLGDPGFHKNPVEKLMDPKEILKLSKTIDLKKASSLKPLDEKDFVESNETTHFAVMDEKGNAVTLTVTLNGNYGSGVVSEKFGVALNNEMDDFTTRPGEANMYGLIQGQGNLVEPGKRPLSSMSPTLVEKDGKLLMALGSPGGPRIISGVIQVLYRTLFRNLDLDMAIQAPRLHHQFLPNEVMVDKNRWSPEVLNGLRSRGHVVNESWMGKVYAVRRNDEGLIEAAFDSRGEGAAGGY